MPTLKSKAEAILNEKEEKIIPENIKDGVTIFDVTGTYEGSTSNLPVLKQRKIYETEQNYTIHITTLLNYIKSKLDSYQKSYFIKFEASTDCTTFILLRGPYGTALTLNLQESFCTLYIRYIDHSTTIRTFELKYFNIDIEPTDQRGCTILDAIDALLRDLPSDIVFNTSKLSGSAYYYYENNNTVEIYCSPTVVDYIFLDRIELQIPTTECDFFELGGEDSSDDSSDNSSNDSSDDSSEDSSDDSSEDSSDGSSPSVEGDPIIIEDGDQIFINWSGLGNYLNNHLTSTQKNKVIMTTDSGNIPSIILSTHYSPTTDWDNEYAFYVSLECNESAALYAHPVHDIEGIPTHIIDLNLGSSGIEITEDMTVADVISMFISAPFDRYIDVNYNNNFDLIIRNEKKEVTLNLADGTTITISIPENELIYFEVIEGGADFSDESSS